MTIVKEKIINRTFYDREPTIVAQELLGKYIVRKIDEQILAGKIVETEAYLSSGDSAAHNFKGQTSRNKSLYGDAGHAYVHSMRQWHLLDVVTEGVGIPGSVLIRAVEPVEGIELMKKFRNTGDIQNLTSGPSKFCQAFQIAKELDGIDITSKNSELYITDNSKVDKNVIISSTRIGISKAKDMPLRFWIKDNAFVS